MIYVGRPFALVRYTLTILAIAAATAVRLALTPLLGPGVPFILYYPTVLVCAWFGGLGPGLLATSLGALISGYVLIPPEYSFKLLDSRSVAQLAIFAAAGGLISLLAESLHRARTRAEESNAKEYEERERFRVTLASIGDAVIATDAEGRINFMNRVAESLTGWSQQEAAGRAMEEVVVMVNEDTRRLVDNPALRAMREGRIVGLANHTILIGKTGVEVPIDDSGAPIKDVQGKTIGAILTFRDISERRRVEKERSVLAGIVESSGDAILSRSLDGTIESWNAAAERLFGYSAKEAVGQPMTIITLPDKWNEELDILQRLRNGERIDHYETVRVSKDGKHIPVSVTPSRVLDRTGRMTGASNITRDITAQKLVEEERSRLLDEAVAARLDAEAANRAKDDFLAVVSHELRTPLSAILGWARLLSTDRLNPDAVRQAITTIERNATAQAELIEDLLDVSGMVTGKLKLSLKEVDLTEISASVLETVSPVAQTKGIQITSNIGPPVFVRGDGMRLQQIVWNLLSNAVKFTPKGGRVDLSLVRREGEVSIVVTDSGQGIRPDFLPHVFERFEQADQSITRRHGGLGLGLSIVRNLVELHGGTVHAQSPGEGQGATFTVTLPSITSTLPYRM
jgi:PAS domain S-box-containing protein